MKNLLLIIALITFNSCFSQSKDWVSYRNSVAEWSDYSDKWIWSEIKFANIPVIIDKGLVKLENKSQSYYTTYRDLGEKITYTNDNPKVKVSTHSWLAIDKDGKRCKFSMAFIESDEYDPLTITIQYDDIALRFYCKRKALDSYIEN
jgi:hypothetical protein